MPYDLEAKIDALPDCLRVVVVLCVLEGFSTSEAAAALGIPEAALKAHLAGAFAFDGERCDRIVARVLQRISSGT